jgi:hypothetical protein
MTAPNPGQENQPPPYQPPYNAPYNPPYPPPPPGYPGYPGYPPPYQPPYNTFAILSLVFAVFVFPPLGIFFGYKAKQQIAVSGERGLELATAGLITGWVLTSIYALFLIIFCGGFLGMFSLFGSVNPSNQ